MKTRISIQEIYTYFFLFQIKFRASSKEKKGCNNWLVGAEC